MSDYGSGGAVAEIEQKDYEVEVGRIPTSEAFDTIAVAVETLTTEKEIALLLPDDAEIQKASLIALITAKNGTANAQSIDITVKAKKSGGVYADYFSELACFGLPNVQHATGNISALNDLTALVTEPGTYMFQIAITQNVAAEVKYTTQYVLIIAYKVGGS